MASISEISACYAPAAINSTGSTPANYTIANYVPTTYVTTNSIPTNYTMANSIPAFYGLAGTSSSTNPYESLFTTSMANDYFGSQIFGENPYAAYLMANQSPTPGYGDIYAQNQNAIPATNQEGIQTAASTSAYPASTATNSTQTMPTIQDYYYATQIANMFSGSVPVISTDSAYVNNDCFAQQAFNNTTNNINNTADTFNNAVKNVSYLA